jgi:hypothetical protein
MDMKGGLFSGHLKCETVTGILRIFVCFVDRASGDFESQQSCQ